MIKIIIAIIILLIILNFSKAKSAKSRTPKLPGWAKLNPAANWGIAIFDSRLWLKRLLIRLYQCTIMALLYAAWATGQLLSFAFRKAKKMTLPK